MQEKTKNNIITIGFVMILFTFFVANIIKKDEEISISERRKLTQFPTITIKNVLNGKVSEQLDKYTVDQFVFKNSLRNIKYFWNDYIFKQKDNNGLFIKDGSIYKIEYPLNEKNVEKSADQIKNICEKYLNEKMNIYYSIIPDKNYYLNSDYLKIDVKDMQKIMKKTLPKITYIDITNNLNLQDYYKTDLHWKQENLIKVVNVLESKMNLKHTTNANYKTEQIGDFYGAYYSQSGRNVDPDKISILTNETIENSNVYNFETDKNEKVYNKQNWQSLSDKYDIFLSGATPLITIENSNGPKEKELILFRDSFGSSIAPLLLENYSKITLIDLRYVSSTILDKYVKFQNQDVLFLYSTLILNQNILK